MALATLTWSASATSVISGSTPTYADVLNKIIAMVNATTNWKVNASNLDAPNSRGWVELAPRSATAGTTEGRCLILFSTGTVAGAAGSERPLQACRNSPWATTTTTLACKFWAGFSSDANSPGTGPTNDPWTSAIPYGAGAKWSKLFPLNSNIPNAGSVMWTIDSAEGLAVLWQNSGIATNGIIFGKMAESLDTLTASWSLFGMYGSPDNIAEGAGGWNAIPNGSAIPPIAAGGIQHSGGSTSRGWGAVFDSTDGLLYGAGRTQFEGFTAGADGAGFISQAGQVMLSAIILSGGLYSAGVSADYLRYTLRQLRWGPPAYNLQRLMSGGIEQAIAYNYTNAAGGAKVCPLWFDQSR